MPVTLQRSGGIAGVRDELTVQPDGSWGRTGRGSGATGRLSADRNDMLTRMAADQAPQAEAGRTGPPDSCAEAGRRSDVDRRPGRPGRRPGPDRGRRGQRRLRLRRFEGMIHGFFAMSGELDRGREAVAWAAERLRAALAPAGVR